MLLWRISRYRDLRGIGGLKAGGRWHYAGQPIVYLSESPSAALLEICVHTAASDVPPDFTLLRVEGPDLMVPSVNIAELPHDWQTSLKVTREYGTEWLRKGEAVLHRVPSAIVPETWNFLFNSLHPDARKFEITDVLTYPFDLRIKQ
jgi:RES domain-containing protein